MRRFGPGEAREWAREHLKGVAGCVQPTSTSSFDGLNETAIRHDVRLEKKLGFAGILLVNESGSSEQEMRDFIDIAVDESKDDLLTILQASAPSLEKNVELIKYADAAGVDLVLPSFPSYFYPQSEDDVYEYYKALADTTDMAMIVFAIHLWNFNRLHPSAFSPRLIGRLIDGCPNVAAVKNEIGAGPGVAGISQVFEMFADRVVVTDPLEMNAPAWTAAYDMQFLGTSNYEYVGGLVPEMFELLQDKATYLEAMDLYWRVHPARQANIEIMFTALQGTSMVHRLLWKYQGWLVGFNGGPIASALSGRINDRQMRTLRASLQQAGVEVTEDPDENFFVGRHPE
jgi:dihydrodipicolinate synthase/N-acetylneuraminate lyase